MILDGPGVDAAEAEDLEPRRSMLTVGIAPKGTLDPLAVSEATSRGATPRGLFEEMVGAADEED